MAVTLKKPVRIAKIYTSDEFENLPQFDARYELVNGRLAKKPMPGYEHSLIARLILKQYDRFDPDEQIGQMLQEVSTKLDLTNTPTPDLAFWKAENKPARSTKAAPRPDLAIEVWSPRDLKSKKRREEARERIRKYQAAGVSVIWSINPARKIIEIYHPDQSAPVQTLGINDELDAGEVIPGFKLKVGMLFA